jgi:hypothetical protein
MTTTARPSLVQNNWPVRLHAARLALAQGGTTGDVIADAYAKATAAIHHYNSLLAMESHESWNESPEERAARVERNDAKRASLVGLPPLP